jgi:hypothetical protein
MKSLKIEINAPEIGETVWVMWLNKAIECEVRAVEFQGRVGDKAKISTTVHLLPKARGYDTQMSVTPEMLFGTKEELLASL